jgi:hypothetical protein
LLFDPSTSIYNTNKFHVKSKLEPIMKGIQRGALFHREDFDKIKSLLDKIRLYNWFGDYESSYTLTLLINQHIRACVNDHHPTTIHDIKVEAQNASITHNKITSSGIVGMFLIFANQSNKFFNYASLGRSNIPETIGQRKLIDEEVRVSMLVDGGIVARGNIINHVAQFGYGVRTGNYYEFGIHDAPLEPSLMFARAVLPTAINHIQNDSFMIGSHSTILVAK